MRFQRPIVQLYNLKFRSVFSAGMIFGILIMCIGKSRLLEETGLFDEDILYRMKYMTVDSTALFCYVLRHRMSILLAGIVLSTTYLAIALRLGGVLWGGISMGLYFAALSIRYGIKGTLLAIIGIFPQILLYFPVLFMLWVWNREVQELLQNSSIDFRLLPKKRLLSELLQILIMGVLTFLGCLLEGYVNPGMVKAYLKIF